MRSILFVILFQSFLSVNGQPLLRRADLGAKFSAPDGKQAGALVWEVTANSAVATAGLKQGDIVIKLNQEVIMDPNRWSDILYELRGSQEIELLVKRGQDMVNLNTTLADLPLERYPDTEVRYESVLSNRGQEIRTIITYPKKARGKLPALFVVGGLSCSSIEVFPGRAVSGWTRVLTDLATKTGMVVMRVEKPGVGDSNGACSESSFEDDIAAFRSSLESLRSKSYVDTSKVIIYGSSMGSALAPYLANEYPVAGVISDGTFVKTWFEHMLEIERRILKFQGNTGEEVMKKMNEGYIPLYYGMLIEKKSYAEVLQEKPWLAKYNYHDPEHMYGRPVSYYHQVQDFNFAKGWQELKVPVRIVRGTNDWIMSDQDNDLIIALLEDQGHQDHQLYRYPGLDHWNMIHEKDIDSFEGKTGTWEDGISQIIIDYARELAGLD
ncbi:MAG: alpha/beta fold hydrolase [Cyclobacteriaceae bacterium]